VVKKIIIEKVGKNFNIVESHTNIHKEGKKLAIIIPYRDRESHLKVLLPELLKKTKFNGEFDIFIAEQSNDKKSFNKAKVMNACYHYLSNFYDYFCFHDVDQIPDSEVVFNNYEIPVRISGKMTQFPTLYEGFFGGVILFSKEHFERVNGFSNSYWGWGNEDDDMYFRCLFSDLKPEVATYNYTSIIHSGFRDMNVDYKFNQDRLDKFKKEKNNLFLFDGLNNLTYTVVDVISLQECIKITFRV